jgi:hypothetical protein
MDFTNASRMLDETPEQMQVSYQIVRYPYLIIWFQYHRALLGENKHDIPKFNSRTLRIKPDTDLR